MGRFMFWSTAAGILLGLVPTTAAELVSHAWSHSFGGVGSESARSVAIDPSGNVIMVGRVGSSGLDLGGGSLGSISGYDVFMAKYDGDGNHLWSDSYLNDNDP